jgi:PAS domain S-box-containing protein
VGKTVREAFPELGDQGFFELLDGVFQSGKRFVADQVPLTLEGRDGHRTTHYLDFIYEPITDEAGNTTGIFVEGHDATEARRASAELRESEERNRRIIEAVKDYSIFTIDANNRIDDWTPGAEAVFGWSADEVRGTPGNIIFTPEDIAEGVPERELATARDRGCANDERWHMRRDGSRFFANGSVRPLHNEEGAITGFIKVARDETERRAAEAAIRETEQRYRLAAKATNDAIWDWDLIANRVEWNEAVQVLFGYAEDEIEQTGDWWISNIHPDDRSRVGTAIHDVIDGGEEQWGAEYRFRRADGTYADVFDRGHVVRDDAGEAVRMIGAMLDLTGRKRAEHALRELNDTLETRVAERTDELIAAQDALRQAQKMEAVGQLTGGIAHDFNNLLAGISGSLEVIERRLSEGRTEGIDRFLSGARTSTRRAAALTQRLLAFSRRQTLDPKPTDVNRLVLGMEDLIHRTVGPAIKIEVVGAAGLWATLVDPAQLESALLNLAINARDAMPDGGQITIETANKWLDDRAGAERDLAPGRYISVCVTDTGTGIPKEIAERIFDPFFTTKPIGQGTGLGLSMIHGFVRQSGGQVRVYSEPGEGTTMCLYLPRYTGEMGDDEQTTDETIAEVGDGQVVLVIDDEPTVRMLVIEVLQEAGYTALEAEDGPSGLKILNSDLKIDLLITDVGLPGGMNGRQVADAARETRPQLKVLFVTGYAENAAISNGHLDPTMAVITKPFVMAELANKITDMIER